MYAARAFLNVVSRSNGPIPSMILYPSDMHDAFCTWEILSIDLSLVIRRDNYAPLQNTVGDQCSRLINAAELNTVTRYAFGKFLSGVNQTSREPGILNMMLNAAIKGNPRMCIHSLASTPAREFSVDVNRRRAPRFASRGP
jgi:hypothetical protein